MATTFVEFQQTDNSATHGQSVSCSPWTITPDTGNDREVTEGGTAGTTAVNVQVPRASSRAAVFFETAASEPSQTTWDSGNWRVRLNVTTANTQMRWRGVYVCRVNSSGVSQETMASTTAFSITLSPTGTKNMLFAQTSDITPSAGDRIYIVLWIQNQAGTTQSFQYTPDVLIDSPIVATRTVELSPLVVTASLVAPTLRHEINLSPLSVTSSTVAPKLKHGVKLSPLTVASSAVAMLLKHHVKLSPLTVASSLVAPKLNHGVKLSPLQLAARLRRLTIGGVNQSGPATHGFGAMALPQGFAPQPRAQGFEPRACVQGYGVEPRVQGFTGGARVAQGAAVDVASADAQGYSAGSTASQGHSGTALRAQGFTSEPTTQGQDACAEALQGYSGGVVASCGAPL